MSRQIGSDQDRGTYRTYDDRVVTRKVIERVIQDLDGRRRRREILEHAWTWLLIAGIVIAVAVVTGLLWWHLIPHP